LRVNSPAATTLRTPTGEEGLSADERAALLWVTTFADRQRGLRTRHLTRLVTAGGVFDATACAEVVSDCARLTAALSEPLVAATPKYRKTLCLGSEAGFELVLRHRLRYRNDNVDPPRTQRGRRAVEGEAQTLGEVPEVARGLELVRAAASTSPLEVVHALAYSGL
jgi:hypothetical protein